MAQLNLRKLATASSEKTSRRLDLVFLHGFLGSAEDWQAIAGGLRRINAYAVDLPGHGRSPAPKDHPPFPFSFKQFSRELNGILQYEGIKQHLLVGYSLGGRLAMYHACRYPGQLHALVVESAHPGLTDCKERRNRRAADLKWHQRLMNEPLMQIMEDWYRQPVFASMAEPERRRMILKRQNNAPHALAKMLKATSLSKQPPLHPFLGQAAARCPVHYIVGLQDEKFHRIAQTLKQAVPDLHLHGFENAGHNVHAAQPECYAEQLQMIIDLCLLKHGSKPRNESEEQ